LFIKRRGWRDCLLEPGPEWPITIAGLRTPGDGKRGEWDVIAKGTADSFEAAKAAALFEAEAASRTRAI